MMNGTKCVLSMLLCLGIFAPSAANAQAGVVFTDIATDPASGLAFTRVPSSRYAEILAAQQQSLTNPLTFADLDFLPQAPRGQGGTAIFDFDNDGDLDIYVTNGPGAPNSLFKNLLRETGHFRFQDVGATSGAGATDQDSTGVCYGDTDNDGDQDLLVLANGAPNRFFENNGDGTFLELPGSGTEGGILGGSACAMADFDGDGLLDIVVANTFDFRDNFALLAVPFAFNDANQLFVNGGANHFYDISDVSGIRENGALPPVMPGDPPLATISWAVSAVDYDLDGDVDVIFSDDQGPQAEERFGGVDRGFLQVFVNDGTGMFSADPISYDESSQPVGEWMGTSFGDLNCDGYLDMFASSFGDYDSPVLQTPLQPPYSLGESTSRWFLGGPNGSWTDPGVGALVATPFGWSIQVFDYDNDGDQDIYYQGGINVGFIVLSDNPGVLLENEDCTANFWPDFDAITADSTRRDQRGVAAGDLNRDGFVDIVTVGETTMPPPAPTIPSPVRYGSPFDDTALFIPYFAGDPINGLVWTGLSTAPGVMTVEIASSNGNRSATVAVEGSVGRLPTAGVNRDGIGAVVTFTPRRGRPVMKPVSAVSHTSQGALETVFGLGLRRRGQAEVMWPGGVRNRLYNVRAGEHVTIPEIPCSIDTNDSFRTYARCVGTSLRELRRQRVISRSMKARLLSSALFAYFDRH
ncbi:MAG: VCBS repeat-containing protein [Myxococcota bacterium]